jgi:hypothetical protein
MKSTSAEVGNSASTSFLMRNHLIVPKNMCVVSRIMFPEIQSTIHRVELSFINAVASIAEGYGFRLKAIDQREH